MTSMVCCSQGQGCEEPGPARNRHEQLKQEEKMMEDQIKVNAEAVESLIRILSKNLDQQLFNKANEIQEEISKKRYDLRCYQIKLSGIRAQKQLYDKTEKQEGDRELTAVQSGGASAKVTGKIKSKWVNAFKNVKGQQGQQNNQAGQPYDKSTRINKQNEQIKKHKELLVKQKEEINKQKELQLNQRLSPRGSVGPDQKRQNFVNSKPPSAESQQLLTPPNELNSGEASPIRRKMGGNMTVCCFGPCHAWLRNR